MVLKRFLTTLLGALGLGVFAAPSALAQTEGNVPAPDGFNAHLECAGNASAYTLATPTAGTGADKKGPSTLDGLLKDDNDYRKITGVTGVEVLTAMFPNMLPNCGSGTIADASKSYQLAKGYVDTYTAYRERNRTKALYDSALKNKLSQNTIDSRKKDYDEALAKYEAVSKGSIYQAGVTEWESIAPVTEAIAEWDKVIGDAYTTSPDDDTVRGYLFRKGEFNGTTFSSVDANNDGDTEDPGDVLGYRPLESGAVNITDVTAVTGRYTSSSGEYQPYTTFDSNLGFVDPTGQTDDTIASIDLLISGLESVEKSIDGDIKATRKNLADGGANPDQSARLEVLNDSLREVRAELKWVKGERDRAINDTTVRGTGQNTTYTIAGRYSQYQSQKTLRTQAEQALEDAVATRVENTGAVQDKFTDAKEYLDQNVKRHQYLSDSLADDATEKDKTAASGNLQDAEDLQAKFNSYFTSEGTEFDADNPAGDLLNALLKPSTGDDPIMDGKGDDGQALVDAVSSLHGNTAANKGAIDTVSASIEGLTGEGGAVDTNTKAIAMHAGEIYDADGNSRIDANETRSMANETAIAANSTRLDGHETDIAANTTRSMANETLSMTNAADISALGGRVGANETAISGLDGRVGANATAINRNEARIGELSESLETVRAGVAASMALAGMPAINGRGISIGVGSFDGESAFAVGFMIQSEMASFKVGVTSAGGATGASAGVGFQF